MKVSFPKKIFAVFVSYNFGTNLNDAVNKVLNFPSINGAIVVDNASNDSSVDKLKTVKNNKIFRLIQNGKNIGFDKAVNYGIKKALFLGADYVVLLDVDLDFSQDFVTRLYNTGGDFVAPVLKFKRNNLWVYDYGGRVNWFIGRTTHFETYRPLNSTQTAVSTTDRSIKNWIDFVSGGCTLIKKEVFERIGYFDKNFFLYFGDTEFSLRARQAGFKVIVDSKTLMRHKLAEHKVTINKFKIGMTLQGNFTFIKKCVAWNFKPLAYSYLVVLVFKVIYNVYLRPYVQSFRGYRQLQE